MSITASASVSAKPPDTCPFCKKTKLRLVARFFDYQHWYCELWQCVHCSQIWTVADPTAGYGGVQ